MYDAPRETEKYPNQARLHPSDALHDELVQMVLNCAELGKRVGDKMAPQWEQTDWALDGFMPESEADKKVRRRDKRKPATIVIPMQFAMREVYLTHMNQVFCSGFPNIHRYRGRGGTEREIRAALMERVVARHSMWFKEDRALDIQWGDAFTYGRGFLYGRWRKHRAPGVSMERVDELLSTMLKAAGVDDFQTGDIVRFVEEQSEVLREGTAWEPIDVYQVFVDPNSTPDTFQDSEFFGWMSRRSVMGMLKQEDDPDEQYFNLRALYALTDEGRNNCQSRYWRNQGERQRRFNLAGIEDSSNEVLSYADIINMIATVIPSEWELGDSDKPERWMFSVAGDRVLIQAHPIGTMHGQLPVTQCAPNSRGHSVWPVSHLMTLSGQQKSIDYIAKSRLDHIRTNLNGRYVIDPSKINWRDFKDGDGPMVVRMLQEAFGEGDIRKYIHQIPVSDVTHNHWGDIQAIMELAKEGSGTRDIVAGAMGDMPERPTARGIGAVQGSALSRLNRLADIIDRQSLQDMAYQMAYNLVQYQSQPVTVDIAGRYERELRQLLGADARAVDVTPWEVDPYFEIEPYTPASSAMDDSAGWTELMKVVLQAPGAMEALMQHYRLSDLIGTYFKKLGVDNLEDYRVQIQPIPDSEAAEQMQAGNIVPIGMSGGLAA